MEPLKISKDLFETLNRCEIRYCHWKSNEHLLEGLAGGTDLDVLFDRRQRKTIRKILTDCGYIRVSSQFGSRYRFVEDWIGFDEKEAKLVHIHLHYRMITGHQGMKEYDLPWTKQALNTRKYDGTYGVYICEPSLELILLHSRIGLKATEEKLSEARSGKYSLSESDLLEMNYLKERADMSRVEKIAKDSFPVSFDRFMEIINDDSYDPSWYLKLADCVNSDLESCSREKGFTKFVKMKFYYYFLRARNLFNRVFGERFITKKSLGKNKGVIIAFIGQDGAGKSTVTTEVKKWLEWKLDVRKYYLGSGDDYNSIPKKICHLLGDKGGILGLVRKVAAIIDLAKLSGYVLKSTKKAEAYAKAGGIVIFDRFPQILYPGINDGPKIRSSLENKNYPGLLKKILYKFADVEERNYRKAIACIPQLVIKLILPPEVSIERKPEESLEEVKKKHEIIKSLPFEKSEVLTINATMDFDEELKLIHRAVWKCIKERQ
ncbi:MAG: hypothetical protein K6E47_14165 [Lachnospiraceae bacterium]|nr:hypothetical protein [Lachnospiraceae bacterium]